MICALISPTLVHQVARSLFSPLDDGFARSFTQAGRASRLAREPRVGLVFSQDSAVVYRTTAGDRRIRISSVKICRMFFYRSCDTSCLAKHPVKGPENLRANRIGIQL